MKRIIGLGHQTRHGANTMLINGEKAVSRPAPESLAYYFNKH